MDKTFVLKNKTNNYAEMYAIYYGLKIICEKIDVDKSDFTEVNIFSDSELCVNTLNKWFFDWLKGSNTENMIKPDKKPVMNQELIKMAIIYKIGLGRICPVNLYHIRSHEQLKNVQSMYKKFIKKNECNISIDEFMRAHYYNDMCDKLVKYAYENSK